MVSHIRTSLHCSNMRQPEHGIKISPASPQILDHCDRLGVSTNIRPDCACGCQKHQPESLTGVLRGNSMLQYTVYDHLVRYWLEGLFGPASAAEESDGGWLRTPLFVTSMVYHRTTCRLLELINALRNLPSLLNPSTNL